MKCSKCKACWHDDDNGGCYINSQTYNEKRHGCLLPKFIIRKRIKRFEKEEDEFWSDYIDHLKETDRR